MRPEIRQIFSLALGVGVFFFLMAGLPAQQWVTETRDLKQTQDEDFAKAYTEWTGDAKYGRPAGRSPAARQRNPDAERRARIPRRRSEKAHLLRGHREVTTRRWRRPRRASRSKRSANRTRARELVVVWVSSDAQHQEPFNRIGTTSRSSPIRAGSLTRK